jgi:benzoyl-CoA reductase/2-hydroxyglutaryl-CoA dehydratase subunit BcrC/BadD/HgdB
VNAPAIIAGAEVVGCLGQDVPVELITAAGLRPVTINFEVRSAGAEAFAEGLGNPMLRSAAAALIEGPYRDLTRVVVSTTPAAFTYLFAFLREVARAGEALSGVDVRLFDLNRGTAESAAGLRRHAMAEFKTVVEGWAGRRVTDKSLRASIEIWNAARRALQRFQAAREAGEARISGADALAVFRPLWSGQPDAAAETNVDLASRAPLAGRRAVYSGEATPDAAAYQLLEARGLVIVADDQDAGSRGVGPVVGEGIDPLTALAERYLQRDPVPARFSIAERTAYLLALAQRARAEHVIFNVAAWDHPAAWDYPSQREALAAVGITSELIGASDG